MNNEQFYLLPGVVSELHVYRQDEDFVMTGSDRNIGAAAAGGVALGGLAGAASTAALNAGDTSERVDAFTCQIDGCLVRGRFGSVGFNNGDVVEAVVTKGRVNDVYAIMRPSDQTIWMHPHCGRGTYAYKVFSLKWVGIGGWILVPIFIYFMSLLSGLLIEDSQIPIDALFWVFLSNGVVASLVFGFTASRFSKFSELSNRIFNALGFEKPEEVDLPKRLREASKTFTNEERLNYHPHARWVYKY